MNAISRFLNETKTTQTEFGKKLNVGQSMVRQWATGARPVSLDRALDIEDAFGIDAEKINPQITALGARLRQREQKRDCAKHV